MRRTSFHVVRATNNAQLCCTINSQRMSHPSMSMPIKVSGLLYHHLLSPTLCPILPSLVGPEREGQAAVKLGHILLVEPCCLDPNLPLPQPLRSLRSSGAQGLGTLT